MTATSMTRERVYLFDTTLRDGAQTQGVDFSVEDKRRIANALDQLGLDYIEGGWPGANPTDTAFFADPPNLHRAKFTAFGMTHRHGRSAENDPGLSALIESGAPVICVVGKTWDFQVDVALEISLEDNLVTIDQTIKRIIAAGREAIFDAEHFFDGYKANSAYALSCIKTAIDAGARWAVLCDTNGGALPDEVIQIVSRACEIVPGDHLGIHTHNDTENAVANSLAAVMAGVRHVQGTLNGLGERCGNANIISLIASFALKPSLNTRFEIGVSAEQIVRLTSTARLLDEILNRAPAKHQPYVGPSAFAHKGGLHVSAVMKNPTTYEHVPPESVGNVRIMPVSDQAGRSTVLQRLGEIGIDVAGDDPRVNRILNEVKEREYQGYAYDGAEASFELLARRLLGQVPTYFTVESYRVEVERKRDASGHFQSLAEAVVKVQVDGERLMSIGEGNGPISALDQALRKDLGKYSGILADVSLVDYKVRILNMAGTNAVTRVMIESMDQAGNRWATVGVSPNIVDASFEALLDSITYKLFLTTSV
jgi:2-isopropylmalate synthase